MTKALIGHTGFVGSNIMRSCRFDDLFNSTNIQDLKGKRYELIVCAGAPGAKWKANLEPDKDLVNLKSLMNCLSQATADHVILISTIDVYPSPVAVDEDSPIDNESGTPYGRHRRLLEEFVEEQSESTIVRLPGLFGPGLKKNVIYDFLNNHEIDKINSGSVFQFYPVVKTWEDIQKMKRHGLRLVNVATEPVSVKEVADKAFGLDFDNTKVMHQARYDMRTKHAKLFGKSGPYMYDAGEVLQSLKDYVEATGWSNP
jgi:nucleoside-diphosphate-sugar epimerase